MSDLVKLKSALISVYNKTNLEPLVRFLEKQHVVIYSTGGTKNYIKELGVEVLGVESVTDFPEILGGRVKTLHPHVFGGILYQRGHERDEETIKSLSIPSIDLVVVDLYPFEETVHNSGTEAEITEQIDIGGVSLLRAAAKNYQDVVVVSSFEQYDELKGVLKNQEGKTSLSQRKNWAQMAFSKTCEYDRHISAYLGGENLLSFGPVSSQKQTLRYGENPHQQAVFQGDLSSFFTQICGKELSYNNLLDVDAAIGLMAEFKNDGPTFAILKHNNACGLASRKNIEESYLAAFNADPLSAFGGVLISNAPITRKLAELLDTLFFEVLIAPSYELDALSALQTRKNRILLELKKTKFPNIQARSILNGLLIQERDEYMADQSTLSVATTNGPSESEMNDLLFANKIVKHTKSNCIVLAKAKTLLASGAGQTSRIDALKQAISKAKTFGHSTLNATMASDAFFPFPDCVEIAKQAGISSVIHPGGSIKDQLSIDFCNENSMNMVLTGKRHFKH